MSKAAAISSRVTVSLSSRRAMTVLTTSDPLPTSVTMLTLVNPSAIKSRTLPTRKTKNPTHHRQRGRKLGHLCAVGGEWDS